MKKVLFVSILTFIIGCKQKNNSPLANIPTDNTIITYAKGFTLDHSENGITVIKINSPWPNADAEFSYALVPREILPTTSLDEGAYDAIIAVPVARVIVTSTTHVPALEALGMADRLVGFPTTSLISSKFTRQRIDEGFVQDLGNNENINTEVTISLHPDLVVGFGINNQNKAYKTIQQSGIPVVYNGEWTEETPLGRAEWIKFFAPFFKAEKKADSLFKKIESAYLKAKVLAENAVDKPNVLTGGLYKDVWHVAGGKSWMATFINDAHADYLWADTRATGGIALSLESVLEKAQQATFWLNPSSETSYDGMLTANRHYEYFDAFKNKKCYSSYMVKGSTDGVLFYELAPNRPDLVLQDLIHIFHPELLPTYEPIFFKPLD